MKELRQLAAAKVVIPVKARIASASSEAAPPWAWPLGDSLSLSSSLWLSHRHSARKVMWFRQGFKGSDSKSPIPQIPLSSYDYQVRNLLLSRRRQISRFKCSITTSPGLLIMV